MEVNVDIFKSNFVRRYYIDNDTDQQLNLTMSLEIQCQEPNFR